MLYVFSGDDTARIAEQSRVALDKEVAKGAHLSELRGVQSTGAYEDLASGASLFDDARVFLVDDIEGQEGREALASAATALAASAHLFVVRASKLDKDTTAALKIAGAKLWDFVVSEKAKRPGLNIFTLADAFGERDKKRAWALYVKAVDEGNAAEEIHGTLFWMVKNLLALKRVPDPAATGLSPFVLQKSVRFARNFSTEELEMIVECMVVMYHDAHRGLCDLDSELEKLILTSLSPKQK